MKTSPPTPRTIDEYIAGFPKDVQEILQKIRNTIREAAPGAEETISYKMPTFRLNGHYLVYFAAHKKHVGFYPAPTGVAEFEKDLALYGAGRGTLQFPFDHPIPFDLIRRVVKFWIRENQASAKEKKKKQ